MNTQKSELLAQKSELTPMLDADPFSGILNLANARALCSGTMRASGPWSFRMPPPELLKFLAIAKGECWLNIEDAEYPPIKICEGDAILFMSNRRYVLCNDLSAAPIDVDQVEIANATEVVIGDGTEFSMVGCHVHLDRTSNFSILDVLPNMIHVNASSRQAPILRWLLDQLVQERTNKYPGSTAASSQIAHLMFIQIMRAYLDSAGPMPPGWLRAMSDTRLLPALQLIHNEPGYNWTLVELARAAAMSRTTFSEHFKNVAGVAPLTYLTEWRMRLAEAALRKENASISSLSERLGYSSVSAFSNAFKRVVGTAPQRVRSGQSHSFDSSSTSSLRPSLSKHSDSV